MIAVVELAKKYKVLLAFLGGNANMFFGQKLCTLVKYKMSGGKRR